jgi:oxygen-dependent protoporphyrinogen oxidase
MRKKIIIVGGGVSGLSVLHHLRKKYSSRLDVSIKLFEKELKAGGTIGTVTQNGFQYETGPNGFLDSKPSTLELAHELGLSEQLITASSTTKIRYLCIDDTLYSLPTNPVSFLTFPLLSFGQKLRVLQEFFIPKGQNLDETVYEFGTRRLGEGFAKFFLAPMVRGIFGGDAKELNLRFAFPKIYQIEQTHGSLFKGMLALQRQKKKQRNSLAAGQPSGQLWSFQNGMGQLMQALSQKYRDDIFCGVTVKTIAPDAHGYTVEVAGEKHFADELILCVPAPIASELIANFDKNLAAQLKQISYASIAVVGLGYSTAQFVSLPKGFGYLRLPQNDALALGALFSSQIYTHRCSNKNGEEQILLQVMLGGVDHPNICSKTDEELLSLAESEIQKTLGVKGAAQDRFLKRWPRAIPQYTRAYSQVYSAIKKDLQKQPHLHLLANYIDGVSLNDCTSNAKNLAAAIELQ